MCARGGVGGWGANAQSHESRYTLSHVRHLRVRVAVMSSRLVVDVNFRGSANLVAVW